MNSDDTITIKKDWFEHCKKSWYNEGYIDGKNHQANQFNTTHKESESKDRLVFKSIPRLLEMIEPTNKAKFYVSKLAEKLEDEGYNTDAKIVKESIKIMNHEKVAMATMDEEGLKKLLEREIQVPLNNT